MAIEFNWNSFWKNYRRINIEVEEDLFFEVGRTIDMKPIKKEVFNSLLKNIINSLNLLSDDILVEFCCGNGLFTYELANNVKQVIAVDFAPHLIETAKKYKSAPQISYYTDNVLDFLNNFKRNYNVVPKKFLMNFSLAYFIPDELEIMLLNIINISNENVFLLFTDVPNELLKWNFYNTEEKKKIYNEGVVRGDVSNAGIGRWWNPKEITEVCHKLNLKCIIRNQCNTLSNYRMDVIITS